MFPQLSLHQAHQTTEQPVGLQVKKVGFVIYFVMLGIQSGFFISRIRRSLEWSIYTIVHIMKLMKWFD